MVVDPPGALRFVQHRAHALGTQRTNDLLVAVGKFFQCEVDLALQDNVLLQLQTGTFRQLQQAQQARFCPSYRSKRARRASTAARASRRAAMRARMAASCSSSMSSVEATVRSPK